MPPRHLWRVSNPFSRIAKGSLGRAGETLRQPDVIKNALLERMHKTASFGENQNTKLQEFADLCADVESRVAHLPGLQCLNFPTQYSLSQRSCHHPCVESRRKRSEVFRAKCRCIPRLRCILHRNPVQDKNEERPQHSYWSQAGTCRYPSTEP